MLEMDSAVLRELGGLYEPVAELMKQLPNKGQMFPFFFFWGGGGGDLFQKMLTLIFFHM